MSEEALSLTSSGITSTPVVICFILEISTGDKNKFSCVVNSGDLVLFVFQNSWADYNI